MSASGVAMPARSVASVLLTMQDHTVGAAARQVTRLLPQVDQNGSRDWLPPPLRRLHLQEGGGGGMWWRWGAAMV